MNKLYKPGEKPISQGKYIEVGPRGGNIPSPRHTTNGPTRETLAPTSKSGNKWIKK